MSAATQVPQPTKQSQFQRVVNTFIAPSKAFAGLDRSPKWWVAWLLTAIVSLLFVYAIDSRIGFDQLAQNAMEAAPEQAERLEQLPPEQRDAQLGMIAKGYKFMMYASPILGLFFAAIFAAVLLGTFNFGMGASVRYSTSLAIVMYAWLPMAIYSLLVVATIMAGVDPAGFRIETPIASNPGVLMNPADSPVAFALLSSLDIFSIWIVVLLGIGFSMNSRVKRGTAIFAVFAWWAVIVIGKVGIAAMRS